MRITDIKTFLTFSHGHLEGVIGGKNWLFVKVETDAGIVGWGECYTQYDRDRNIEVLVHELKRYLVGRDPFAIKHFTSMVYNDFSSRRGAMDLYCAVSGIELALWDVVGKRLNTPVYNLLGGPCRDRIRVYANGWGAGARTPEQWGEKALEVVRMGFTALKFDPFPGPWRLFISPQDEDRAVANVRAVRAAVGPEVEILVEVHRRLAPMHAVRVARRMAEYRPFWYEEPVPATNIPALAEVRRQISIPVVTGEELYTKADFREVFEAHAADIINPDVCNCGGLLELKEIGAMAEPYYVAVSPHNYNSTTIALAATVQAAAVMPNFIITEYFVNFTNPGNAIAVQPLKVESSYIALPAAPGLGLELREEELLKRPYEVRPQRALREYHEEP